MPTPDAEERPSPSAATALVEAPPPCPATAARAGAGNRAKAPTPGSSTMRSGPAHLGRRRSTPFTVRGDCRQSDAAPARTALAGRAADCRGAVIATDDGGHGRGHVMPPLSVPFVDGTAVGTGGDRSRPPGATPAPRPLKTGFGRCGGCSRRRYSRRAGVTSGPIARRAWNHSLNSSVSISPSLGLVKLTFQTR